ncbi:IS1595 family transposase [Taibaiella helva]|uniref:IS1595 family transposase n=1 Tax=Taibaiella helva TaxID=2301235 RepID=UPI000E592E4B|nr:IS1595 family transposase [Taibaiella helva]
MKQFKSLLDLLRAFPDERACEEYLVELRWPDGVKSPFDPESKVYRLKGGKFKCRNTGKRFSCKVGTIFQDSNVPLTKWFIALFQLSNNKKGTSSHQLAKDLDVKQETAWHMLHRLRDSFEQPLFISKLDGIIAVDECYVGGKNKNRHRDKKFDYSKELDKECPDKIAVWGAISADGKVRTVAIPDVKKHTLQPLVYEYVRKDSTVVSDEWKSYKGISESYWHETVDHGKKEYMNDNGFTTNKIENYWSVLKRTINGTYNNHISRKHIQRYCNEISFRFNTKDMSTQERFDMVLRNCEGRLSYQQVVYENKTRFNY